MEYRIRAKDALKKLELGKERKKDMAGMPKKRIGHTWALGHFLKQAILNV